MMQYISKPLYWILRNNLCNMSVEIDSSPIYMQTLKGILKPIHSSEEIGILLMVPSSSEA